MIDRNKFNRLLNSLGGLDVNFTMANGPFPNRKACAVCTAPSGGMSVSRPVHFFVQHPASGCPGKIYNAYKQIPAVGSGQADWVTCIMTSASGNKLPVPDLWYMRTNGAAPNQANAPSQYWVEVRQIGYGY